LRNRRRTGVSGVLVVALSLLGLSGLQTQSSAADTDPPAGTPATVSADPLPTWQIDGVVWSQALVGTTVYAVGKFTKARPPGAAAGAATEVTRANILAYNVTTGNLITSFAHTLDAQGLRVVASPDGKKIYVGGDFTTVDGQPRKHIVAFDTATGALDPNFHPTVSNTVRAIATDGTTVYYGGNFFNVDGRTRTRLAASDAATGALSLTWKPAADDDTVYAMALSPDRTRLIVGGRFQHLNGTPHVGVGAVDTDTGAIAPWSSSPIPARSGSNFSYVTDLQVQGDIVYAGDDGEGGHWFDGRWAANVNTGDLVWLDNCYGATYSVVPVGQALYSVSHAHDCSSLGAFPQTTPTTWHRALAETIYPTGTDQAPPGTNSSYSHQPIPSLLHWFPTLSPGTVTGQYQAAWSVVGNSSYLAVAGEFPRVEGKAQQGLQRYAIKTIAPNKFGPEAGALTAPTATSLTGGKIRVAWKATWDHDNNKLKYEVLRDGGTTPIYSTTVASTFWALPKIAYLDADAPSGAAHTYKVRVTDPFGNSITSGASNSITAGTVTSSPYSDMVASDGAADLWRLGEPSGTTAYDYAGGDDLTLGSGVTRNAAGAIVNDTDKASAFNGTSTGLGVTPMVPTPGDFSVEAWFKTSSTKGGKIIGYGNKNSGSSASYDRNLYLTDNGTVVFGVYPGTVKTVQSGSGLNNNKWHHVVGTLDGGTGIKLYVDGTLAGSDSSAKNGQSYGGYWRIGGDNLTGWPSAPTSPYLNGTIDDVAVYPKALTAGQVSDHYGLGTGTVTPNKPPTAAFTSSCTWLDCTLDGSASADTDGTVASYAWDFGDGKTGTGQKPTHTYALPGAYTVKLTVTDNKGDTDYVLHSVPVQSKSLASDSFGRSVSGGFGTADLGGAWTTTGASSDLSVNGSAAEILLPAPSTGPGAYLNSVSTTDADVSVALSTDKVGTGNGIYMWVAARRISGAGEYRARVRLRPSGVVSLQLSRTNSTNSETAISTEQAISGLTYAAGTVLHLRLQAVGTSPTELKAKVWAEGTAEPDWQFSASDSTADLQAAGSVGVRTYLSGSATNAPITLTLDDFTANRTAP
jgi:PKD repeat protein